MVQVHNIPRQIKTFFRTSVAMQYTKMAIRVVCRVGQPCPVAARKFRAMAVPASRSPLRRKHPRNFCVRAESEQQGSEIENPESEAALKAAEAERLRAAEKFMVVGTGEAECKGCGYAYKPGKGDPEYPIPPGVQFKDLPADWQCPVCGAEKSLFQVKQLEVAGFAENQGYGLGTNSMTGDQKSLLIFGSLGVFFLLFLLGYTLN